jgi:hypothetical protein
MKASSGTFAFVVLAVIVIVAIVSCRTYQIVANQKYVLEIGTKTTYVEWTTQGDFDKALKKVCRHGGNYDIRVLMNARAQPIHPYNPCPPPGSIKTDRVTMSKVAQRAAAGESAGNDPNVTNRVAAANGADITTVLNALK